MSQTFGQYYFTEAKISAFRQIANLFSSEKKIDINIKKDLKDFHQIDENTFHNITEALSRQYQSGEAEIQHRYKYRVLAKKEKGGLKPPERSINNVYKGVLKGDKSPLGPYDNIEDVAVYETTRRLLYRGYIVVIVTDYNGVRNYFLGADKNGLIFFKELTGMNMNTYVRLRVRPKRFITRSPRYEPKEEKPKDKAKEVEYVGKPGYVEVIGGRDIYRTLKANIIKSQNGKSYEIKEDFAGNIKATSSPSYGKYKNGIRYLLVDKNVWFDVVLKPESTDAILVFENKSALLEADEMGLFDDIEDKDEVISNVDFNKDINKLK